MTEFNVNQIQKRVFTIACRKGTAIITDSKPNANGNGSLRKFEGKNSQLACLKALNDLLQRMPSGVRFDYSIAILLPESINFLAYEDTRNYWIANGCKKNGEVIEEELMNEVKVMHQLLRVHNKNLQIFNQKKLTSNLYKTYNRATWKALESIVPSDDVQTVSCESFE